MTSCAGFAAGHLHAVPLEQAIQVHFQDQHLLHPNHWLEHVHDRSISPSMQFRSSNDVTIASCIMELTNMMVNAHIVCIAAIRTMKLCLRIDVAPKYFMLVIQHHCPCHGRDSVMTLRRWFIVVINAQAMCGSTGWTSAARWRA